MGFENRGESSGQVCILTASGRMNFIMLHIWIGTPGEFARERAQVMGKGLKKAEDLPGVAEAAFWNAGTTTVAARKKGHAVILSGIYRKAAALRLIKKAAARLPQEFARGPYSARNVIAGSTRAARHAGIPHARSATPARSAVTAR